jgi:hypothetical protein
VLNAPSCTVLWSREVPVVATHGRSLRRQGTRNRREHASPLVTGAPATRPRPRAGCRRLTEGLDQGRGDATKAEVQSAARKRHKQFSAAQR